MYCLGAVLTISRSVKIVPVSYHAAVVLETEKPNWNAVLTSFNEIVYFHLYSG